MKICKCDICKQELITRRVYNNGIKYMCDFCINVEECIEEYDSDTDFDSSVGLLDSLDKKTSKFNKIKSNTILDSITSCYDELERKWNNFWFVPLWAKSDLILVRNGIHTNYVTRAPI